MEMLIRKGKNDPCISAREKTPVSKFPDFYILAL